MPPRRRRANGPSRTSNSTGRFRAVKTPTSRPRAKYQKIQPPDKRTSVNTCPVRPGRMVRTKNSMSGHVQGCPAVQPEPLAQRADLLAFDQLTDGPPEPPAQGIVG